MVMTRKRMVCMVLAFLLLWAGAVSGDPIDNFYTPREVSITINADTIPLKMVQGRGAFQYVPIASYAGYETTFDAENCRVISARGDDRIVLDIHGSTAEVQIGGRHETFRSGAGIADGSTYIPSYDIGRLFGYYVSANLGAEIPLRLYDPVLLTQKLREKSGNLISVLENMTLLRNFQKDGTYDLSVGFRSEQFGIQLTGSSDAAFSLRRQEDALQLDFSVATDGLFNFYRIPSYSYAPYAGQVDLSTPLEGSVYVDGSGVFLKSDTIGPQMLVESMPLGADPAFISKSLVQTQGKWVHYEMDDYMKNTYGPVFDTLFAGKIDLTPYFESVVSDTLNHVGPYGYDAVMDRFDAISRLTDAEHLSTQVKEGKKMTSLRITPEEFRAVFGPPDEGFYPGDLFNYVTSYGIQATMEEDAAGNSSGSSHASFTLSFLPDQNGIRIGDFTAEMNFQETVTAGAPGLAKPVEDECISFQGLFAAPQADV